MAIVNVEDGRNTHRLLFDDNGKEVSHLAVVDFQTRIDDAIIVTAGIGDVRTLPEEQGKGYCDYLMNDTIQYMKDNFYDTSTLIGIPDFYHRYGYKSCTPVYSMSVESRVIFKGHAHNLEIRPVLENDFDFIVKLYNENNKDTTGTIVRDRKHFNEFFRGSVLFSKTEAFIFSQKNGEDLGYFVYDKNYHEMNIVEMESTMNVYSNVLGFIRDIAQEKFVKEVNFFLPQYHPIMHHLKHVVGGVMKTHYTPDSLNMSRICNIHSLFDHLKSLFEHRLHGVTDTLLVRTDIGAVYIYVNDGEISFDKTYAENVLDIGQSTLMQVLYGYISFEEVLINNPTVWCVGKVDLFTKLLTPKKPAYLYSTDLF